MFQVASKGRKSDTFYITEDILLRTQTSAHQNENLKTSDAFCVFADVYRRDQIDATHYPAFHQLEAVRLYHYDQVREYLKKKGAAGPAQRFATDVVQNKDYRYNPAISRDEEIALLAAVYEDIQQTHEALVRYILGKPEMQVKWVPGYFPFTEPSFELEAFFGERWVEMLGCGNMNRSCPQAGVGAGGQILV